MSSPGIKLCIGGALVGFAAGVATTSAVWYFSNKRRQGLNNLEKKKNPTSILKSPDSKVVKLEVSNSKLTDSELQDAKMLTTTSMSLPSCTCNVNGNSGSNTFTMNHCAAHPAASLALKTEKLKVEGCSSGRIHGFAAH